MKKKLSLLLVVLLLAITFTSCTYVDEFMDIIGEDPIEETSEKLGEIDPDGRYTSKEDVALYIHKYGELPKNFIRKGEAKNKGWNSSDGNLWEVTEEKSIGGDSFGNREGNLPEKDGRQYYEADIDYDGGYRGAKRIVYSNDGLVYYTDDHYETFTLLYGDE